MLRHGVWVFTGIVVLLVACTSPDTIGPSPKSTSSGSADDDDDDDDDDPKVKAVDGTRYIKALCAHEQRCAPNLFVTYSGECVPQITAEFNRKRKAPDDAATQANLDGCAAVFEKDDCTGKLDDEVCNFRGTRNAGAPCATGAQCKTSVCAKAQYADECGICAELATVGQSCVLAPCAHGLFCNRDQRCTTLVPRGGTCEIPFECEAGLACVAAKCATPIPLDGACALEGSDSECQPPLRCVGAVCASVPAPIIEPGGSCGPDATGQFPICRAGFCNSTSQKCVPRMPTGGLCDEPANTAACNPFLLCKNNTCQAFDYNACN